MPVNVMKNGVVQFTADRFDGVSGDNWNFATDAPPPPGNDPNALGSIIIRWVSHQATQGVADCRQMKSVFGRSGVSDPVNDWPYDNGSTVSIAVPRGRHLRLRMDVPPNAGVGMHMIKGVSYGSTAGKVARVAVVSPGLDWTQAHFRREGLTFNDNPWLYLTTGMAANPSRCSLTPGSSYDLLIGYVDEATAGGTMVMSWV